MKKTWQEYVGYKPVLPTLEQVSDANQRFTEAEERLHVAMKGLSPERRQNIEATVRDMVKAGQILAVEDARQADRLGSQTSYENRDPRYR